MKSNKVEISLSQGDMHLYGMAPKEYVDRMLEIVNRDPPDTWVNRGLELLETAIREFEADSSLN